METNKRHCAPIVPVPSPHKLHYTALLTLYIVSMCGHPCSIIGAHAQPHIPSGHQHCLNVSMSAVSLAMTSLVSCLHLVIYTLYNKHIYTRKKQYSNKDYLLILMYLFHSILWVLYKLLFPSIFVFKFEVLNFVHSKSERLSIYSRVYK